MLKKTLITIISAIVIYMIGYNIFLHNFIMKQFVDLEKQEAIRNLNRIEKALDNEIISLKKFVYDWSVWDDTYDFIIKPTDEYLESNLVDDTFIDMGINLIYLINNKNELVWGKILDFETEEEININTIPELSLREQNPFTLDENENFKSGLYLTSNGYIMLSICRILRSDSTGPSRGYTVMGIFLNDEYISTLNHQMDMDFEIIQTNMSLPAEISNYLDHLSKDTKPVIKTRNNIIESYKVIPDIFGNANILIKASSNAEITQKGISALNANRISLLVLGLIIILILFYIFKNLIIKPIVELKDYARNITSSDVNHDLSTTSRNDEIGNLVNEFDHMLKSLNKDQIQLTEQSYLSGISEIIDKILHNFRNISSQIVFSIEKVKQNSQAIKIENLKQVIKSISNNPKLSFLNDKTEYLELNILDTETKIKSIIEETESLKKQVTKLEQILVLPQNIKTSELKRKIFFYDFLTDIVSEFNKKNSVHCYLEIDKTLKLTPKIEINLILLRRVFLHLLDYITNKFDFSDFKLHEIRLKSIVQKIDENSYIFTSFIIQMPENSSIDIINLFNREIENSSSPENPLHFVANNLNKQHYVMITEHLKADSKFVFKIQIPLY